MRSWRPIVAVVVAVLVAGFLVARAGVAPSSGRDELPETAPGIRFVDGLDNIDHLVSASGLLWAVTSDLDDGFSSGAADASILRIDPATGEVATVIEGLEAEPSLVPLQQLVWAKLVDRVVTINSAGAVVRSFEWDARGDLFAGERFLWLTDFSEGGVTVIDPSTVKIVAELSTGRFPVAPIVAFGHAWIPSSIEQSVTVIGEETVGKDDPLVVEIDAGAQLVDVTAVPGARTGDEVWLTNLDGDVFAVSADARSLGATRIVAVDRSINRIYPRDDVVLLLPTWGQAVLVADLTTEMTLAEVGIDSIPVRATIVDDLGWISGDGTAERLSAVHLPTGALVEQFDVGENSSTTTGPRQPVALAEAIWVPNRGDDRLFAIEQARP